jgi:hypothetical protein
MPIPLDYAVQSPNPISGSVLIVQLYDTTMKAGDTISVMVEYTTK